MVSIHAVATSRPPFCFRGMLARLTGGDGSGIDDSDAERED